MGLTGLYIPEYGEITGKTCKWKISTKSTSSNIFTYINILSSYLVNVLQRTEFLLDLAGLFIPEHGEIINKIRT